MEYLQASEVIRLLTVLRGWGAVIALVFAVLNCFWGYRLQRLLIGAGGFFAGMTAGWLLFAPHWEPLVAFVVAFLLGILLCILAFRFFKAGVFLAVLAACTVSVGFLGGGYGAGMVFWLLGAVLGLILGVVAVKYTKPVFVAVTSVFGGSMMISSVLALTGWAVTVRGSVLLRILAALAALVLMAGGMRYQFKTNKFEK